MKFNPPKIKESFIKYGWQCVKAVICFIQLFVCQALTELGMGAVVGDWYPIHVVLLAVNALVCIMVLYHFYDEIDDWSFLALKQEKKALKGQKTATPDPEFADMEALYGDAVPQGREGDDVQPTHLMKKPGWIAAYLVGIVVFGYMMGRYLVPILSITGMPAALYVPLGYILGGLLFAGLRLWRVCALNNTWRIQIDLVKPGQKKYASLIKRILQCVFMHVAMAMICYYAGGVYVVVVLGVFLFNTVANFAKEFPAAAVAITVALLTLLLWGKIRLLSRWGKFMKKLKKAKKKGEIDYTVEGNVYLAALFPKLYAGLVVTDKERYKGDPVTYCVGICNVKSRREAVILCDEYRAQIRHSFNLRLGGRALAIAASAENTDGRTGHALFQWHTTVGLEFPEGEGERILLVDPAPTKLYLRDGQTERLQELDNGSRAYDYTVYTKNAFFNIIERT